MTDQVKEMFQQFVASPLAPQFPSAHEEQEALWFFRAGHASAGLVWTQEHPTQEGWYWTAGYDDFEDACIRHIYQYSGNGVFYFDNDGASFPEDMRWWAGPLLEPERP